MPRLAQVHRQRQVQRRQPRLCRHGEPEQHVAAGRCEQRQAGDGCRVSGGWRSTERRHADRHNGSVRCEYATHGAARGNNKVHELRQVRQVIVRVVQRHVERLECLVGARGRRCDRSRRHSDGNRHAAHRDWRRGIEKRRRQRGLV